MTTPSHTPATALNITDAKFRLSDIKTLNIKQLQIKKAKAGHLSERMAVVNPLLQAH